MKRKNYLWNAVRQQKSGAFRQLYFQLYDSLFQYGLQQLNDKMQTGICINEVFAELWEKAPALPAVDNVEGYIFIIFKRKIFHYLKKKQTIIALTEDEMESQMENVCSYEEMVILMQTKEEEKTKIMHALSELTDRQREMIRLKYYLGSSVSEIAQKLNLTHRTVYNTLHSAIATLRKVLKR